jgi:hypothetical protein
MTLRLSVLRLAGHALVGGTFSVIGGGKFGSGALAGGFSAAVTPYIPSNIGIGGGLATSSVVGGTASVLGGGKFGNGALTGAFGYLFSGAVQAAANGQDSLAGLGDFAGKIWGLPNTAIGLAVGIPGYALSWGSYALGLQDDMPGLYFQHNAIEFTNNVAMFLGGAITLGNTEIFGYSQNAIYGDYNIGWQHEMQHTFQSQILGPLYLPTTGLSLGLGEIFNGDSHGPSSFMEVGPTSHPPRPWP